MNPASALYGAMVAARNGLYDRGLLSAGRLSRPVVSIGNISVGGTGKTPFTIMLGEMLRARGVEVDVLSRGYRRTSSGARIVDPAGGADEFGDEPLLIARRLGAPVVVGENRWEAGVEAERKFARQLHLLDDGFQHRKLARDFDIVLLAGDEISEQLLPFGRLREPLNALGRADAIVVAEDSDVRGLRLTERQQLWRVKRGMKVSASGRQIAFCGIARPERFFEDLRRSRIELAGEIAFSDHHRYSEADARRVREVARERQAEGFVTTAKDEINLGRLVQELQPLAVAEVTMELVDAESAMDWLFARLHERGHRFPLDTTNAVRR